ncbi:SCO4225 family membrane protein [Streptomyces sp. CA-243310]|uniref:SCO4225 family membrane protein n=1 Tax=Streptomyces sp. CA-243310 TaxID=3240056 RepID=UPI003D8ECE0E
MNARTFMRLTVANRASAIYLGLIACLAAMATAVTLFADDPGFVWVWPVFLALPTFFLVGSLGAAVWGGTSMPDWFFFGGILLSVLIQSFALGVLLEGLRRRRTRTDPGRA